MLTTPILKVPIIPFDKANSNIFKFDVYGGDQVTSNRLVVSDSETGLEIYNQQIETFKFEHETPANTFINGKEYIIKIKTYNAKGEESEFSVSKSFKCLSTPTININNMIEVVPNNNYTFQATYHQAENELVKSYNYYLYDLNGNLLTNSGNISDNLYSYSFTGFKDDTAYLVEIKAITENGIMITSNKQQFYVNYEKPLFNTAILLENMRDKASVKVNAKIFDVQGQLKNGTMNYELDEWINLKNGTLEFIEEKGFYLNSDFTLKLYFKDVTEFQVFLKLYNISYPKDYYEFMYRQNRIYVTRYNNGIANYRIYTDSEINNTLPICIWFQQKNGKLNLKGENI